MSEKENDILEEDHPPVYEDVFENTLDFDKKQDIETDKKSSDKLNSLPTPWKKICVVNSPFPRYGYSVIYDPEINLTLLNGGFNDTEKCGTGIWYLYSNQRTYTTPDKIMIGRPPSFASTLRLTSSETKRLYEVFMCDTSKENEKLCLKFHNPFKLGQLYFYPCIDELRFHTTQSKWLDFRIDYGVSRYGYTCNLVDNNMMYIFGGVINGKPTNKVFRMDLTDLKFDEKWKPKFQAASKIFAFEPQEPTLGDTPPKTVFHGMTELQGTLFVYGGINESGKINNALYSFEIATKRWTQLKLKGPAASTMPGLSEFAHVKVGRFWVINGGRKENGLSEDTFIIDLHSIECFVLNRGLKSELPHGISDHQMVYESCSGKLIVFSGSSDVSNKSFTYSERKARDYSMVDRFDTFIYELDYREMFKHVKRH